MYVTRTADQHSNPYSDRIYIKGKGRRKPKSSKQIIMRSFFYIPREELLRILTFNKPRKLSSLKKLYVS
jgi:hypothetical protein